MPRDLFATQSQVQGPAQGGAPVFEPGMDSGYTIDQLLAEQQHRARGGRPSAGLQISDEDLAQLVLGQADHDSSAAASAPEGAPPPAAAPRDLFATPPHQGMEHPSTPYVPKHIRDMGTGEQLGVGLGLGVLGAGQGIKQALMHASGMPAAEAEAYDAELREQDKLVQPLRDHAPAAKVAEIVGASAPAFLIPPARAVQAAELVGGQIVSKVPLLSRLGTYAAQGGAVGGTQPVLTEGGDFATEKAKQTAIGAATGMAAGAGLSAGQAFVSGRAIPNLVGKAVNPIHRRAMATPVGQEGARLSEATGIELTPAAETGSKSLALAENAARQSFFTADQAAATDVKLGEQAIAHVNKLMDKLKKGGGSEESVGNEVMAGIKNGHQQIRSMRDFYADKDYGEVRKLAGNKPFFTFDTLISEARAVADEYANVAGADPQKIRAGVDRIVSQLMGQTKGQPASKVLGPNGLPVEAAVPGAPAPVQVTIDQAMKQRSALSKATQGGINLFEDVQGAEQRAIAVRLLKAAEQDFAANGEKAGADLGQALTRANSRYRSFNQSLDFVAKSPLGRMLGEDLTNAAFGGQSLNTTAAEKFAQRFKTMTPSELKVSVSLLQAHAPQAVQSVRRYVLEDALNKGMQLAPSAGVSGPRLAPNKFVNALLPDENMARLFDKQSQKEIGDVVGAMRRWADVSGKNHSGTAANSEFLAYINGILDFSVRGAATLGGKAIGMRQIASAMENPRGRGALLEVLKAGPKTERAIAAAQILATESVLEEQQPAR
jgi:hypothetical protein